MLIDDQTRKRLPSALLQPPAESWPLKQNKKKIVKKLNKIKKKKLSTRQAKPHTHTHIHIHTHAAGIIDRSWNPYTPHCLSVCKCDSAAWRSLTKLLLVLLLTGVFLRFSISHRPTHFSIYFGPVFLIPQSLVDFRREERLCISVNCKSKKQQKEKVEKRHLIVYLKERQREREKTGD